MMGKQNRKKEDYLFSKGLRDALSPFAKMDVREAVQSVDFMKALCDHAGMSDEKFNEILNSVKADDKQAPN